MNNTIDLRWKGNLFTLNMQTLMVYKLSARKNLIRGYIVCLHVRVCVCLNKANAIFVHFPLFCRVRKT